MKLSQKYFIAFNYKNCTAKEIAEKFNLNHKTVHEAARKLNLVKSPNWSKFEVNFLIIFGAKKSSIYLGRSLASCKTKLSRWKNTNCTKKLQRN